MSKKGLGILTLAYLGVGVAAWALQGAPSDGWLKEVLIWPLSVVMALVGVVA